MTVFIAPIMTWKMALSMTSVNNSEKVTEPITEYARLFFMDRLDRRSVTKCPYDLRAAVALATTRRPFGVKPRRSALRWPLRNC